MKLVNPAMDVVIADSRKKAFSSSYNELPSAGRLQERSGTMPRTVSKSTASWLVSSGSLAMLSLLAGCFFTRPINSKPDANLLKATPGPHFRGDKIFFSAADSDDADGDELEVDWRAWTCQPDGKVCDETPFQERIRVGRDDLFAVTAPEFRVIDNMPTTMPTAIILVEITVRDRHGATDTAELKVDVQNHQPTLILQVQGAISPVNQFHPIGIPVRVVARAEDPEGDPVSFSATRRDPGGGALVLDPIAISEVDGGHEAVYEFVPDEVGTWQVEVDTEDGLIEEPVSESAGIAVQEDAPPCIAITDPPFVAEDDQARFIVERASGARRFAALQVSDDLDVYPPPGANDPFRGSARFQWFLISPATAGQRVEIAHHDLPDYTLDATAFTPGDQLSLQVQVSDRVVRTACAPDETFCALQGPPCYQRITWEVEIR